jgi:hypothetical protein
MNGDYGQRAAAVLRGKLPRQHRAKTVAGLFNISLSMAKYLLAGDHWTTRRLMQASELLGDAFDAVLIAPENQFKRYIETLDIDARVARSEQQIEQIRRRLDDAMAPAPSLSSSVAVGSPGAVNKQTSSAATDPRQDDDP